MFAGLRIGVFCLLALARPGAAAECPRAPLQPMALPHMRQALSANDPIVIVAIGSSSTEGWMASDIGHSYPAVLQAALSKALPGAHVAVINRGVGGQDAAEEVPRLQSDVLALKPQLVIWQVGANGALRDTAPTAFKHLVSAGLRLLRSAGTDVILMDNQRAPALLATQDDRPIDQALAELARTHADTSLFSRLRLMDAWQAAGMPYARFVSNDGLHHNDLGYRCISQALAASMLAALRAPSAAFSVVPGAVPGAIPGAVPGALPGAVR